MRRLSRRLALPLGIMIFFVLGFVPQVSEADVVAQVASLMPA
ncbi:MAG: hypothetical protein ACRDH6_01560 [Actinomycetota bacterium]